MPLNGGGRVREIDLVVIKVKARYEGRNIRVEFTLPEKPVTQVNAPGGSLEDTRFKLFPVAAGK